MLLRSLFLGWFAHDDNAAGIYRYAQWVERRPFLLEEFYPMSFGRNSEAGLGLVRRAAELGHPEAMWALGVRLEYGHGAPRSYEGRAWMERARASGYAPDVAPNQFYYSKYL